MNFSISGGRDLIVPSLVEVEICVFVRPKLMSRPMLLSSGKSSLMTDLEDETLLFGAEIPGPTLFELEVGGARNSRSVRDVDGGGLLDAVRLLDRVRVGGFRLLERSRRVLEFEGGRLLDRPAAGR